MSGPQLFASVGSMFAFDRFVAAIDDWAGRHPDVPVLVQIGAGDYLPRHAEHVRMMPPARYRACIAGAKLFVAHAGMGSIISAIEAGKPLLIMPRDHTLGEHTTDHQLATLAKFRDRPGIHSAATVAELHQRIDALFESGAPPPAPIAPYASPELIDRVRGFIAASRRK